MVGLKILGVLSFISTTGVAILAQVPKIPDRFETWPATAILGLITLASLSVACFVVKKSFESRDKLVDAMIQIAEAQAGETAALNELNKRLNVRPCLIKAE